jgi:N-methylhydantoinase B/oxoprolinase/acetone carboxylase alpha subunit
MGVVSSGLSVVADAIGITTIRAAYSTTIKGGADVSGGLFDARGRLVVLSDTSMIGHLAPLRCAVRSILADFPPTTISPGDVFIMNMFRRRRHGADGGIEGGGDGQPDHRLAAHFGDGSSGLAGRTARRRRLVDGANAVRENGLSRP